MLALLVTIVSYVIKVVLLGMLFVFTTFDITAIKINLVFLLFFFIVFVDVNSEILKKMFKDSAGWRCKECGFSTTTKARTWEHIEREGLIGVLVCNVGVFF